ncbi:MULTISPECIES: hypothetical protein [unclassified Streptomyces]|uniref:hypothetical protein n=1 Tax=unclassified Streptomyces TaxID=2593676 RepID=UPI001370E278|nr:MULTISPECIES: hypothetical protein [unclassified Streptomyces]NEA05481.1 hypothetical protein [Streptomyces sp. SID10116]MYY81098.1 hypothetical protein [Streptomyces sp. SID335]MYZ12866.1 hypothetical protein [Streptomyces sp. SID337]NDZ92426.1 hypothetical protein [Streptomyces sp. SID10115]NEB48372.1 hypothetical protein [Streptomyces sp. SID339]
MTATASPRLALLLTPLRRTAPLPRYATRILGATLAAGAYVACLPWDLRNRPETPGALHETSPVSGAGVTLLSVALLALAAYFGVRDRPAWTLLVVAVPPATLMYVSFDTHPTQDAQVWPLAWAAFTLLFGAGTLVTAVVARRLRGGRPELDEAPR